MKRISTPLTLTALVLALAAGVAVAAATATAGEPQKETKIKLVLSQDGAMEKIELEDLHDLALGESRAFTTESGKAGTVTRTGKGFELDLDGRKITLAGEPDGAAEGEGDVVVLHKKIEIAEGDDATKTMVWHSAEGGDGHQVRVIKKLGGPDGNYAFFAGPHAEMHAAKLADAWIERLRQSAEFQALDATTRERVEAALRATAPGGPGDGATTMVIEVEEQDEDGGE
jgi:hypothetical protein